MDVEYRIDASSTLFILQEKTWRLITKKAGLVFYCFRTFLIVLSTFVMRSWADYFGFCMSIKEAKIGVRSRKIQYTQPLRSLLISTEINLGWMTRNTRKD